MAINNLNQVVREDGSKTVKAGSSVVEDPITGLPAC